MTTREAITSKNKKKIGLNSKKLRKLGPQHEQRFLIKKKCSQPLAKFGSIHTNFKFEEKLYPPGIPQVILFLLTEHDFKISVLFLEKTSFDSIFEPNTFAPNMFWFKNKNAKHPKSVRPCSSRLYIIYVD